MDLATELEHSRIWEHAHFTEAPTDIEHTDAEWEPAHGVDVKLVRALGPREVLSTGPVGYENMELQSPRLPSKRDPPEEVRDQPGKNGTDIFADKKQEIMAGLEKNADENMPMRVKDARKFLGIS